MWTPTFILLGTLVLLCTHAASAGCGGCSSSRARETACEDRTAVTRTATKRVSTSSGWLFWRRRSYRTQYYTETTYQKAYTCCRGYRLEYRTCVRTDCGISKYSNAGSGVNPLIIGGIDARENEFPWQIYLNMRVSDRNHYCGGTIISDQYILTAAHCVYGRPVSGMTVYAGQHTLLVAVQSRPVKQYFVSGYISNGLINDIAILKLSTPLTLGDTARPACLPNEDETFVGRTVIISGWGWTVSDSGSRANTLQYTKVKVAPTETCERIYGSRPHMICGTDGRSDTDRSSCKGDSGGPMVLEENGRFVVIGLSSFSSRSKGCAGGRPFGYVGVSGYIPWIKRVTGL